jgi:hypothetical protein
VIKKVFIILAVVLLVCKICDSTQQPLVGKYRVVNTHFVQFFDMEITDSSFFQYPYHTYRIDADGTIHMTVYEFGEVPRDFYVEQRNGAYYFYRQNSNNLEYQLILIGIKKEKGYEERRVFE